MTQLYEVAKPTREERKRGAEVVFVRSDGEHTYRILGCRVYESWEQWNAPREVLSDNCDAIEAWRHPEES